MKQTFDTDSIMFSLLNSNQELKAEITGGIYSVQRPLNSVKEDVVVNTITLTQDSEPQTGVSNINVHVPDKQVTIAGVQQTVVNSARLKAISEIVLTAVREARIEGLKFIPESQTVIQESEIKQHYCNIRINWNIH
jgi:hypothetical protein